MQHDENTISAAKPVSTAKTSHSYDAYGTKYRTTTATPTGKKKTTTKASEGKIDNRSMTMHPATTAAKKTTTEGRLTTTGRKKTTPTKTPKGK